MPVKPVPGEVRAVWGPNRKGSKWQVVVQTIDGVRHARTVAVKLEAESFAVAAKARIVTAAPEPDVVPEWDGSTRWFADRLSNAVRVMLASTNPFEREWRRKEVDSISKACQAAPKLIDLSVIEARVTVLEEQEKAIAAQRKHGPRAGKQAVPTREPVRPGTPLR